MELEKDGPSLQIGHGILLPDGSISVDKRYPEIQLNNPDLHDEVSLRDQSLRRDENSNQGQESELKRPKSRNHEWPAATKGKTGPLRLLDLPLDVLKEIIKEVTHTNDLASLALTHSALHQLVTPHIYSRFDIVWPDTHSTAEPRTGVDALTYGLATLVMNEEILGTTQTSKATVGRGYCELCTCNDCKLARLSKETVNEKVTPGIKQSRRGNYFARYIRKFSIGNGPSEWVQEYLIAKEGGKMLGTLVALAIARMPNLETFIWDMPTGILRDVWASLSLKGNYEKSLEPKLEKVWVRFHDNREVTLEPGSPQLSAVIQDPLIPLGIIQQSSSLYPGSAMGRSYSVFRESFSRIEYPNFSILPPLKSLSVLDIDELAYLWEINILVEKSLYTLRELRIGMASYLSGPDGWASGKMIECIGPMGVIGAIMGNILTSDKSGTPISKIPKLSPLVMSTVQEANSQDKADSVVPCSSSYQTQSPLSSVRNVEAEFNDLMSSPQTANLETLNSSPNASLQIPGTDTLPFDVLSLANNSDAKGQAILEEGEEARNCPTNDRLCLETLAIERVSLHIPILQKAIDWSVISSLTLLRCGDHEQLWEALRRKYAPQSTPSIMPQWSTTKPNPSSGVSQSKSRHILSNSHPPPSSKFQLNLKKIHTDAVSPALITFLKETLAPNSLEWLFLQDGREYVSPVTLQSIYRGPIRRHRASLRKIMVDSAIGKSDFARNQKRKKWIFSRELLEFITSGKVACLKELTMTIKYSDWHFFLQRLPQIPHLCSLHIPYIADHVYGSHLNARELALQLVDVVAIRSDIRLLYIGLFNTCFELLENSDSDDSKYDSSTMSVEAGPVTSPMSNHADDDDNGNNIDVDHSDSAENPVEVPVVEGLSSADSDDGTNTSDDSDEDMSEGEKKHSILKLREILFYDDKISIFKARHGRL